MALYRCVKICNKLIKILLQKWNDIGAIVLEQPTNNLH